jgi:hypothetical protein
MPKGKPWTVEEEKQLREFVKSKTPVDVIAERMKKSPDAVMKKCERLGLEVVDVNPRISTTTSKLPLPKDLPSVEEALKMLAGALKMSCKPGLDKVEVQRLQVVATLARTYKEILADYLDYRGVEVQLLELRRKYEQLAKKAPGNASK